MFIATAMKLQLALQRSAMFAAVICEIGCVPLLWSWGIFWGLRSINITSLRDKSLCNL